TTAPPDNNCIMAERISPISPSWVASAARSPASVGTAAPVSATAGTGTAASGTPLETLAAAGCSAGAPGLSGVAAADALLFLLFAFAGASAGSEASVFVLDWE